jgi:probable F420-dependent oxidoreductase
VSRNGGRSIVPEGTLAYGLQLPIQSQSTIYREPWEADAGVDDLAAIARACDDAGFLYVAVCDHVAIPDTLAPKMGTSWWDTMTTLGFLAGVTSRVRLMSHVYVLPYRHPLMTAKAFLTLDELSHGRAILGAGAGHVEAEFDLLGVDFASRGQLLNDALAVVRAAFAEEFPAVDGGNYPVRGFGLKPRPTQAGGPPIWIGGSSPAALRRAADHGDGWLPQGPPKEGMKAAVVALRARREQTCGGAPIDVGVNAEPIYVGTPSFEVESWTLTGSADEIAARLRRYRGIGVDQMQLRFRSRSRDELVDQIEAFGRDVAPLLND